MFAPVNPTKFALRKFVMRYRVLSSVAVLLAACSPKSDLDEANRTIARLQDRVSQLEAQLARKPPMPIDVACRQALMGPGQVLVINTTIKSEFPVLVTWQSKSLGTMKQFRLDLSATLPTELSYSEGAPIESGDPIRIENKNYESVEAACP